jgi:hypothetical protein
MFCPFNVSLISWLVFILQEPSAVLVGSYTFLIIFLSNVISLSPFPWVPKFRKHMLLARTILAWRLHIGGTAVDCLNRQFSIIKRLCCCTGLGNLEKNNPKLTWMGKPWILNWENVAQVTLNTKTFLICGVNDKSHWECMCSILSHPLRGHTHTHTHTQRERGGALIIIKKHNCPKSTLSRKVAVSIPDGVIGCFIDIIIPTALWRWGWLIP